MGKSHCGSKKGINQGAWNGSTISEPIRSHGDGEWRNSPVKTGLKRCGKNCTLGSMNYPRRRIKRRNFSSDEEELILRLHRLLGNRWSLIAGRLPGRTDNEIKNHWNTYLTKKLATNERQAKGSHSLKTRPESPAAQNHALKTIPVKTKAVRYSELLRSNGCNIYGDNSRPGQSLKLSDVKEFDVADHSFNVADNRAGKEE